MLTLLGRETKRAANSIYVFKANFSENKTCFVLTQLKGQSFIKREALPV